MDKHHNFQDVDVPHNTGRVNASVGLDAILDSKISVRMNQLDISNCVLS